MAKLSQIAGNLAEEAEVEYDYDLGIFVTIRPMPNPQFDAYLARAQKGRRRRRASAADGEEMNELVKAAIAHTVVTGVRGLEDDDGTPIEYTVEWGLATFRNPEFYDFFQFCRTEAANMANFDREAEVEASGN